MDQISKFPYFNYFITGKKKMKTSQMPYKNKSTLEVSFKSNNEKILIIGWMVFGKRWGIRGRREGGKIRNKMQTSQIPSQNIRIYVESFI